MSVRPVYLPVEKRLRPDLALPYDYEELTKEGQRKARINACRHWLVDTNDKELRAEGMVLSLKFFDKYYLWPDEEADFDPWFYDEDPLESPEFHWEMSRVWAMHRMSVTQAPRGSAKSTHSKKDMILRLVSRPKYSLGYCTSNQEHAEGAASSVRSQCYALNNRRLADDWSREPEFGGSPSRPGKMKPMRGEVQTGVQHFYLPNGSHMKSVSAKSRLRGMRPIRFRLDDPEHDASASTSMAEINEYMEKLLFTIVVPMILKAKSGVEWVGTMVSPKHYLTKAMQVGPDGVTAEIPQFNRWARMEVPVGEYDEKEGRWRSCWPQMWPANAKEREDLGLDPDSVTIEEMPEVMGPAAFQQEMLGQIREGTGWLAVSWDVKGKSAWWLEGDDGSYYTRPAMSETKICWLKDGEKVKRPLVEFLQESRTFITVDGAYTDKPTSDRKVVCLMSVTRDNELFVLDLESGTFPDSELVNRGVAMGMRWNCKTIWIETVKQTFHTYQRFYERWRNSLGGERVPIPHKINPGMTSKTSRISALDQRCEGGLLKLPMMWRNSAKRGPWNRLMRQVELFDPAADNGGLSKDDEIDAVQLGHNFVATRARGRLNTEIQRGGAEALTIDEVIDMGGVLPDGTNLLLGISPDMLDEGQRMRILRMVKEGKVEDADRWTAV